jgi:hypothetical protein
VREQYENEQTLANEAKVMRNFAAARKLTYHKLPKSYEVDYLTFNEMGEPVSVVEVKCRNINHNDFPTFYIALRKFMKGFEYVQFFGHIQGWFAFTILVLWNDATGVYTFGDTTKIYTDFSGRTVQTRDSADLEPMVHIPIDEFEIRLRNERTPPAQS